MPSPVAYGYYQTFNLYRYCTDVFTSIHEWTPYTSLHAFKSQITDEPFTVVRGSLIEFNSELFSWFYFWLERCQTRPANSTATVDQNGRRTRLDCYCCLFSLSRNCYLVQDRYRPGSPRFRISRSWAHILRYATFLFDVVIWITATIICRLGYNNNTAWEGIDLEHRC